MAIQQNSFEAGTSGSVITPVNSGGASGNAFDEVTATTPTFTTAQAAHGTLGMVVTNPSTDFKYVRYTVGSGTALARFYLYVPAAATEEHLIAELYTSSGGTKYAAVGIDVSGKLFLVTSTYKKWFTATDAVPLNTWVRVELYAEAGTSTTTGTARMAYYLGDDTTAVWDSTTKSGIDVAGTAAAFGYFYVGKYDTTAFTGILYFDDIGLKTDTDAAWGAWPVAASVANNVRPNAVAVNTDGYTNVGGAASIAAALADETDTTYAQSPDNPSSKSLTVSFPEIATGDITVLTRNKASASTPTVTRLIELLQTTTVVASRTITLTTSAVDHSFTTTPTETATITDRTALRLRITDSV